MLFRSHWMISIGLCLSFYIAPCLAFAGSKTPAQKPQKPVLVKSVKPLNPSVPYTFSSDNRQVMVPQTLTNLLSRPTENLPEELDFLRTLPIEIGGYPEAAYIPESTKTADQVVALLTNSPNIPVHMEILRRSYFDLPSPERKDLVVKLLKRYEQSPDDTVKFFDFGYAQLVYLNNKSGLFFLRKANDRLKTPFTNLAYAMGQAEVDLNQEKSAPSDMNVRKLDVIHKMADALSQDVQEHQPGFWPSYIRVVQKLSKFLAYQDFTKTDFSARYVPVGQKPSAVLAMDLKPEPSEKTTYTVLATQTEQPQVKPNKRRPKTTHVGHITSKADIQEPPIAVRSIPNTGNLLKF